MTKNKLQKNFARENILRESEESVGRKIEGYDFNQGVDYEKLIQSFSNMGIQASNFSEGVDIINEMIREKAFIYFGYTSNMVTCGMRDIIRYLAEHKKVNILVTTSGGIEEDIIKCLGDFTLGDFCASGEILRDKGINRAGNIFIPNSRYCRFEEFIMPILKEFYSRQKETGKVVTPSELIWKLGEKINDKKSIYYWANKNKIKVFCPAITDGSIGDMIYFFKSKHSDFLLDVSSDICDINNTTLSPEKTGIILLGAGTIKHHICNANMFRNGANYAVYLNTAQEFDGSDSGAIPEEAVSWGKISKNARRIKIYGEASIIFPLIITQTFLK